MFLSDACNLVGTLEVVPHPFLPVVYSTSIN